MSNKTRNSFYSLWSLAILLCLALSIFVLLFASCSKGGSVEAETEQIVITDETENATTEDDVTEDTATIMEDTATGDDGEAEIVTDEGGETETETEAETENETEVMD